MFCWCNICQSHAMLCTHCFVCWAYLTGSVFIIVPQNEYLFLKILLTLKWSPMHWDFSDTPQTYGVMTMPWYVPPEGQLLLLGLTAQSMKCCGYSLSIRSCFTFLISLLTSFTFWHMTPALLMKLQTTPLFTWRRWLDLKCKNLPVWVGFLYHFVVKLWPLFMIKISKKEYYYFKFHCESNGRSEADEEVKKLLQCCWPMKSNLESIIDVS